MLSIEILPLYLNFYMGIFISAVLVSPKTI